MENSPSPIETLRQLKEMLDAGTITPAEFEALKQKLVFNSGVTAATEESAIPALVASAPMPSSAVVTPEATVPFATPPVTPAPSVEEPAELLEAQSEMAGFEIKESTARNPLNLILSIGGLLALLGLVLYLSLNKRDSEHISSTSQTEADSLAAPLEEGPQAEQPDPTAAAPETIRVAPTNPAPPVVKPVPATNPADSATVPTVIDSTVKQ